MHLSLAFVLAAISLHLAWPSLAQTQGESAAGKGEAAPSPSVQLKAINTPMAAYPEEARKKGIEGKVTLRVLVDATGKVSQAKAVSGPQELIPAALASVKMWQYEEPTNAPVMKIVVIGYGFPKECPGRVSDVGEVEGNGRLLDKNGKLVATVATDDYALPLYPEAERRAGITGTMILSITLRADGRVKEIHAVKSLSPKLDRIAMDTVLPLRFEKVDGNADTPLEDVRLQFMFRASCNPLL